MHREDGSGSIADLDRVLDLLAQRGADSHYHIGGGEPFLQPALLQRAVAGMVRRGLRLDYVETNATWVRDQASTTQTVRSLADAGLRSLLVSLSPFHAEHIPLERTLRLVAVAQELLPDGVVVWIPEFWADLADQPRDRPVDLDALIAARGQGWALSLADRYSLVAAGRAADFLVQHGRRMGWRQVAQDAPCWHRLPDTHHFHVDLSGRYVPGLCSGLALDLEEVPGPVPLERYDVLQVILYEGLEGLVDMARRYGFQPHDSYASACHLCQDARRALFPHGFRELAPAGFYDPRSWD